MNVVNHNLVKKLFPTLYGRGIMDRLKKDLCYRLSARNDNDCRMVKSDNPATGSIEIVRFFYAPTKEGLETNITNFYKSEGFEVSREESGVLNVSGGKRKYRVMVTQMKRAYHIRVYGDVFSLVED